MVALPLGMRVATFNPVVPELGYLSLFRHPVVHLLGVPLSVLVAVITFTIARGRYGHQSSPLFWPASYNRQRRDRGNG